MKALSERDPFRVGIVAIVVGALVVVGVIVLSLASFGTHTYTAELAQTAGLRPGEDIQVHGVPMGTVKSIELAGSHVKVTFVMKKQVQPGSTTSAAVKVATLLGTHYLSVIPSGPGTLADDVIPLVRTSVPYNLQDVLEKGTANLRKLDPVVLAKALTEVSRTMSASGDQIGPALTGVARLSEAVQRRNTQTGQLLSSARSVTDQLSDSSADLVGLMKQANLVVSEITSRRQAIHTLLVETSALSVNLSDVVTRTKADLGPAFRQLNAVLKTLREQDKSLKSVLDTMAPTLRYFANAAGSGPWADLWLNPPAIPPDDMMCRVSC